MVFVIKNRIAGHVAFSPVKIGNRYDDWYGLGPVSVRPDVQKQKIGTALIIHGLEMLRAINAAGCVLVGDPGYYLRFGFNIPELLHDGVPD